MQTPDTVEWRAVVGFEGRYEVNRFGEVRGLLDNGGMTRIDPPRILRHDVGPVAQHRVHLRKNKGDRGRKHLVHRLVWAAFVDPIPPKMTINHIDGSRHNNRLDNLELATMREQMLHAYRTGLQKRQQGQDRINVAKLTNEQVLEIRDSYRRGERIVSLAKRFPVSDSAIYLIVRRQRWAHLP